MNRREWRLLPIGAPLVLIALMLAVTACSPTEKPVPTVSPPASAASGDATPSASLTDEPGPRAAAAVPQPETPATPTTSALAAPVELPATAAADSVPVAAAPASSPSDVESPATPAVAAIDASEPAVPEPSPTPASSGVREEPGAAVSGEPLQPATDATAAALELAAAEESAGARTEEPVVELLVGADETDRTPSSEAPAPAILDSAVSAAPQTAPIRVEEAPPPVAAEPADEDAGPSPLSVATEVPPAAVPEDAGEPAASPTEDVGATLPDVDALGAEIPPFVLSDEDLAQLEAAGEALEELFSQSASAFAGLESYRYRTVFSFTGEESGEAESGSIEVHCAVASADRQTLEWKDLESGEEFAIVRVEARAWMREGDEWAEVPEFVADAMSEGLLIYSPVMGWSLFAEELETTSTFVGEEVVNGIPTKHYTSSYASWPSHEESEVTHAEGDVWIAEAGYPVRYRFAAKVTDSEGESGSVLWTMELSDVNAPITIEAP